jgi:hypothetical protein
MSILVLGAAVVGQAVDDTHKNKINLTMHKLNNN